MLTYSVTFNKHNNELLKQHHKTPLKQEKTTVLIGSVDFYL